MALQAAAHRAAVAQLCLCAGITSFILAMTVRRLRKEYLGRHKVSSRSRELTSGGTPEHILEHIKREMDDGYVCLAIAENKLTVGPLLEKLLELADRAKLEDRRTDTVAVAATGDAQTSSPGLDEISTCVPDGKEPSGTGQVHRDTATTTATTMTIASSPLAAAAAAAKAAAKARLASMGYGDQRGPFWVRREIADMMGSRMFHREVDPDNLCIAAGATSVLRLLMVALMEQGQGCLIPAPYFAGFDKALTEAGVKAWAVSTATSAGGGVEGGVNAGISPRVLQSSLRAARAQDVEVRVLLITSPHNPIGRLYTPKALLAAVAWARKRRLHVVVDEVYANCVHRPNAAFRSVGDLLANDAGMQNDVHVVYGLSKDLGVAGWRVGVLYSENRAVVSMMSKLCHTSQASSDTLDIVGRLFREPGFMDSYFQQHQEGLRAAYVSLAHELGRKGIMHIQAEAGLFVMLDLREFLEDSCVEAEANLWRRMLDETGVNLTPGTACHCPEPGWFRLCFAYQENDVVTRAVERLADFLREEVIGRERLAQQQQQEQQEKASNTRRLREPLVDRDVILDQTADTTAAAAAVAAEEEDSTGNSSSSIGGGGGGMTGLVNGVDVTAVGLREVVAVDSDSSTPRDVSKKRYGEEVVMSGVTGDSGDVLTMTTSGNKGVLPCFAPAAADDNDNDDDGALGNGAFSMEGERGMAEASATTVVNEGFVEEEAILGVGDEGVRREASSAGPVVDRVPW